MGKLTIKRQAWVEEYLKCWNATEAARRTGFANPNTQGPRLLLDVSINQRIHERIREIAMSSEEVVVRLAAIARSDMGDFLDITDTRFLVDLNKAKELGLTHLIKKVKSRTVKSRSRDGAETEVIDVEAELYDKQAALVTLGRHLGLFGDKLDITSGGKPIKEADDRHDRAMLTLADAIRETILGQSAKQSGAVASAEQAAVVSPS